MFKFIRKHSFLVIVLTTIILTRLWALSLFVIFKNNQDFLQKILSDSLHHYYVGIAVLLLVYPLRKLVRPSMLSAVGLGIIFEEMPVVLGVLGLDTNKYYLTSVDLIIVIGTTILGCLFLRLFSKSKSLKTNSTL